jgi:trehalose 6-phosphate phosphatase
MTAQTIPLDRRIAEAPALWLFLDYDGTLADFAPTPDVIEPQPEVAALITRLRDTRNVQVAIVSGRRLDQIEKLVPVEGVFLAGTYGIELRNAAGEHYQRTAYTEIRPTLERLKPGWAALLPADEGFYLEDKAWSLALHARHVRDPLAAEILEKARRLAKQELVGDVKFQIVGGHKFLEVRPRLAHKGKTVTHLWRTYPLANALPIYIGDDDKDAEAFDIIHAHNGMTGFVSTGPVTPDVPADFWLADPEAVHQWLKQLLTLRQTT